MTVKNPPTKESLFSIGEHFYALESLIIDLEEITEEIDQWLKEYQAKEQDKADAYCYLIQKFEEIAQEAEGEAKELSRKTGKAEAGNSTFHSYCLSKRWATTRKTK